MKIMRVNNTFFTYSKTIELFSKPDLDNNYIIGKLSDCFKGNLHKMNLSVYHEKRQLFFYNNYKHSTHTGQNILQIFNFIKKGKIQFYENNKSNIILIKYEFSYFRIVAFAFLFSFLFLILVMIDKKLMLFTSLIYFLLIGFSLFSIIFFVIKNKLSVLINDCLKFFKHNLI